jgi:hypothetical protein
MPIDFKALAADMERAARSVQDRGTQAVAVASMLAAVRGLVAHVDALEQRVAAAEQSPLKYLGTYEAGRLYSQNHLVTDRGSLWIALRSTQQRPGDGDGWQLCAKKGADGRDAR